VRVSRIRLQALDNAPCARGALPQGARLYVTTLEPTTEPSEAAPASVEHAADISALLPQVGLPTVHVDQHHREVCRLSPWVMLLLGSTPIRPITGRPSLAPLSIPAVPRASLTSRCPGRLPARRAIASYYPEKPLRSFSRMSSFQPASNRLPRRLLLGRSVLLQNRQRQSAKHPEFAGPWSLRTRLWSSAKVTSSTSAVDSRYPSGPAPLWQRSLL